MQGVKLNTHPHHLLPRLRMSGVIPLLPQIPNKAQKQLLRVALHRTLCPVEGALVVYL